MDEVAVSVEDIQSGKVTKLLMSCNVIYSFFFNIYIIILQARKQQ